jgi:acyl transferase domain-containing protein
MVAVNVAVNSLLIGDCDIAIVLGNNAFGQKDFQLSLQACGVLVEGPTSHPFDQEVGGG